MEKPITPAGALLAAVFCIHAGAHRILYTWCAHCLVWNEPEGCLCGRPARAFLVEV